VGSADRSVVPALRLLIERRRRAGLSQVQVQDGLGGDSAILRLLASRGQQRFVMEFALETASRRCEVIRLGPQHVKDGRIRIERAKGSKDVDIPL
jgi:integrase